MCTCRNSRRQGYCNKEDAGLTLFRLKILRQIVQVQVCACTKSHREGDCNLERASLSAYWTKVCTCTERTKTYFLIGLRRQLASLRLDSGRRLLPDLLPLRRVSDDHLVVVHEVLLLLLPRFLRPEPGDGEDAVARTVDHGVVGRQAVGRGQAAGVAVLADDPPVGVHGELWLVHHVHGLEAEDAAVADARGALHPLKKVGGERYTRAKNGRTPQR